MNMKFIGPSRMMTSLESLDSDTAQATLITKTVEGSISGGSKPQFIAQNPDTRLRHLEPWMPTMKITLSVNIMTCKARS